ncbi:MAG: MoaD family protein, partial [Acidobacteria bacterium]|nr:MoaD family protein [Acidobacteriota bacterium]
MPIEVNIPAPFRRLTGNRARVSADGGTVEQLLTGLESQFPGFRDMLFDEKDRLPPHIKIYVNGQEIAALNGLETALKDGDTVAIIPATAGGSPEATLTAEQRERYS